MSRNSQRLRRFWLVTLYLALLAGWGFLLHNTYVAWLDRHALVAQGLALAAAGPPPLTATPAAPVPAATGTASPSATPAPAATLAPQTPTTALLPTATLPPAAIVHPKTGRYLSAWLPTAFDAEKARESFEANKALLDEVSPFWYTADPATGGLVPEPGGRDPGLVEAAHAADVLVLPTIHNVYDPLAILPLLEDPGRRTGHIEAILAEIDEYGYDGVDVDYEMLPESAGPAYAAFMRELSERLHARGKILTVAVHAKSATTSGLGGFQDWKLLGEVCDRVRIMAYDFHWIGSSPGPIAPLAWVSEVAEYAKTTLPAAKIQIGVPFYGYNWSAGQNTVPLTWNDVQQLISIHRPVVNLQERDASGPVEESWFTYAEGVQARTVWFASSRALEAKLELIERLDLGGLVIWRLGNEDPRNWEVIRDWLIEHPRVIERTINSYLPEH